MHRPVAYTYQADYHCPDCTFKAHGQDDHGYPPEDAEDAEGNPIGAVAPWDEWWWQSDEPEALYCADCGASLATHRPEEAPHAISAD